MVKMTPFNIFGHPNLTFSLLKAILEPKMTQVAESDTSCKKGDTSWFGQLFQV